MEPTHIHLLLNHFPIIGTLIGLCLLIYGLIRKNRSLESAALVIFVMMALLTIPVFLSGEDAEETVEHLAGVSEHFIEEHEELAETGLYLMTGLGLISLLTLFARKNEKINLMGRILVLLLGIATFAVMTLVGNHGGKIRHSEIRKDQQQTVSEDYEHEHESGEEHD